MKPSTSDKIFSPSSLPVPIFMAESTTDSDSLQPTLHKLPTKPYAYKKVNPTPSIEVATHFSGVDETTDILYRSHHSQASSTKPSAAYANSESKLASANFELSTFDSAASKLSSPESSSNSLAPFMKSVFGEKAFNSISPLSVSFFVSGILLMFYLLHLI